MAGTERLYRSLEESAIVLDDLSATAEKYATKDGNETAKTLKLKEAGELREDAKTLRAAAIIMRRKYLFDNWKQYFTEPSSVKLGVCSPKEMKTLLKARHLTAFVSMGLHLFQINSEARAYFQSKGNYYFKRHDKYPVSYTQLTLPTIYSV